jgi:hypothetical protein
MVGPFPDVPYRFGALRQTYGPLFARCVALQFGIGVAAYRISRGQLPRTFARLASYTGALGLIAIYIRIVLGWSDHLTVGLAVALATISSATPSEKSISRASAHAIMILCHDQLRAFGQMDTGGLALQSQDGFTPPGQ